MAETILVVDDDEAILKLLELNLSEEGFNVSLARDGREALECVSAARPDLVLLDIMVPKIDGFDVCREMRRDHRMSSTAIIMLTAKGAGSDKVLGLTAGADDYITKPFEVAELMARVRSALRRNKEMTALNPLTRLPGNIQIEREAQKWIDRGSEFAVLYADLDHFKAFNDHYGFLRGDDAIRFAAGVLCDAAGTYRGAFVGHVGGDDFVVLAEADDAQLIAQRATTSFDLGIGRLYDRADVARGFISLRSRDGTLIRYGILTLSIGVAMSRTTDANHRQVIDRATIMKRVAKAKVGSATAFDRRHPFLRVIAGNKRA